MNILWVVLSVWAIGALITLGVYVLSLLTAKPNGTPLTPLGMVWGIAFWPLTWCCVFLVLWFSRSLPEDPEF